MSELTDLYQEVILDHNRAPRNFGRPADTDREAKGHNPLCGDRLTVYLKVTRNKIVAIGWEGDGCAISKASASTMSEAVKGKSRKDVEKVFQAFHALVTGKAAPAGAKDLGKLAVFSGVSEFPMRVKCATLAWHTLQAALAGEVKKPVSTE